MEAFSGIAVSPTLVGVTADQFQLWTSLLRNRQLLDAEMLPTDEYAAILAEVAAAAKDLHESLRSTGRTLPVFAIELDSDSTDPADETNFYQDLQHVDELIASIDEQAGAHDKTLGGDFRFRIYSRRDGFYYTYSLLRTANGWEVRTEDATYSGCKDGRPGLFDLLDQLEVLYPKQLENTLSSVWNRASYGLSTQQVQDLLDGISDWINRCEQSAPTDLLSERDANAAGQKLIEIRAPKAVSSDATNGAQP